MMPGYETGRLVCSDPAADRTAGRAGPADLASPADVIHALHLLAGTGVEISLYRLDPPAGGTLPAAAVRAALGPGAMVAPLSAGGWALGGSPGSLLVILIGGPMMNDRFDALVASAVATLAPGGAAAGLHRSAESIGDPEDLLLELEGLPGHQAVTRPVADRRLAGA